MMANNLTKAHQTVAKLKITCFDFWDVTAEADTPQAGIDQNNRKGQRMDWKENSRTKAFSMPRFQAAITGAAIDFDEIAKGTAQ